MSEPVQDRSARAVPPLFWVACVGALCLGVGMRLASDALERVTDEDSARPARLTNLLQASSSASPRVSGVYFGHGTWVDAFDFDPAYRAEGTPAAVTPALVEDLAAAGVETIYLQAARLDDRATGLLLDEDLLAEFLLRAHALDLRVVGWYLPHFADVGADLERLQAIAEFEALGHRFDGVAVDIEQTEAVPDPVERSTRLVDLSTRLRDSRPSEALGAIVPPAVQLEVINPAYWPNFPWRALEPLYDVWLPMTYWTTRSPESGYRDPYTYTEESVRRMRSNLGRPDAPVHPVGGIGDAITDADLDRYGEALAAVSAVGGSIYDWASMPEALRSEVDAAVP